MDRLLPGQTPTEAIEFDLINGARWTLGKQPDDLPWRLIVVYRGKHCPVCKIQLQDLAGRLDEISEAGIALVAASMDGEDRATSTQGDWGIGALPIAYGLDRAFAQRFGLYVSASISENEPDAFFEPAMLLFHGETFYAAWIQSTPFARPPIEAILDGLAFVKEKDYPARGTVAA